MTEESVPLNACATDDCNRHLKRHVLMCRTHWRMVPKHMQRDVNGTWRTAQRMMKQPMAQLERVEAVRDYLVARRAATDFVNGRLAHE